MVNHWGRPCPTFMLALLSFSRSSFCFPYTLYTGLFEVPSFYKWNGSSFCSYLYLRLIKLCGATVLLSFCPSFFCFPLFVLSRFYACEVASQFLAAVLWVPKFLQVRWLINLLLSLSNIFLLPIGCTGLFIFSRFYASEMAYYVFLSCRWTNLHYCCIVVSKFLQVRWLIYLLSSLSNIFLLPIGYTGLFIFSRFYASEIACHIFLSCRWTKLHGCCIVS